MYLKNIIVAIGGAVGGVVSVLIGLGKESYSAAASAGTSTMPTRLAPSTPTSTRKACPTAVMHSYSRGSCTRSPGSSGPRKASSMKKEIKSPWSGVHSPDRPKITGSILYDF